MNGHYSNDAGGDLLVERRSDNGDVQPGFQLKSAAAATATAATAALAALATCSSSGATATLHSGNWPEMAMKSCMNRLHGNGNWARYCTCDNCQPNGRRRSSGSNGSCYSGDDWEPTMVTNEQLQMSYEICGLQQNELPIKGTYIDPRIMPGFTYRVRYLGNPDEHQPKLVFPDPVPLMSIGAGYGKRLTFDTKQLQVTPLPAGHFWSDSCPEGYALSLVPVNVGQRFSLQTRSGQELGRVTITWVAPEPAECRQRMSADSVTVRVAVAFKANISLTACRCLLGCHEYNDVPLTGLAWLERAAGARAVARVTRVEGIRLPDMPDLRLVPADLD